MRRLLIQERFDSFRREVIPQDAPLVQITECRRAFFAGAQTMKLLLLEAPPDLGAERRYVEDIERELQDFVRREVAQALGSERK